MTSKSSPAILVTLYRQETNGSGYKEETTGLAGTKPTAETVVISLLLKNINNPQQICAAKTHGQKGIVSEYFTREDLCRAAGTLAKSCESKRVGLVDDQQGQDRLSTLLTKLYTCFPEVPHVKVEPVSSLLPPQKLSETFLRVWFERTVSDYPLPNPPQDDRGLVLALLDAVPVEQIQHMRGIQIGDQAWHRDDVRVLARRVLRDWQRCVGLNDSEQYARFQKDVLRAFPRAQSQLPALLAEV